METYKIHWTHCLSAYILLLFTTTIFPLRSIRGFFLAREYTALAVVIVVVAVVLVVFQLAEPPLSWRLTMKKRTNKEKKEEGTLFCSYPISVMQSHLIKPGLSIKLFLIENR